MSDFYTGGLLLNHSNSIHYYTRPFTDTDSMNECLLENINKLVRSDDRLYIVANMVFGPLDETKYIRTLRYFRNRINCDNLYLIYGNHDRRAKNLPEVIELFNRVLDYMEVKAGTVEYPDISIILFGYPILMWNRQQSGALSLHSTMHGKKLPTEFSPKSVDISVDNVAQLLSKNGVRSPEDYRPLGLNEICDRLPN